MQLNSCMLLVRVQVSATSFGKQAAFAKAKLIATLGHSHSTTRPIYLMEMCAHGHQKTYTRIFMATLFLVVNSREMANETTNVGQRNKLWYIHTVEDYIAVRMIHYRKQAVWMNLIKPMLSERSQTPNCMILFLYKVQNQAK